ncbi:hypothetical protein AHV54_04200 [Salmonella enterica subsp. enterica]|nr:hypothetical protein [Salmonella enterica subsp. enterica serovar Poona]
MRIYPGILKPAKKTVNRSSKFIFSFFSDCLRSCANPRIARHSLNHPRYKLRFQEMKHTFH